MHDIEDLCNYGRSNKACPYFASRKMADVRRLGVGWGGSVVRVCWGGVSTSGVKVVGGVGGGWVVQS